jgi:hypothetical protein
MRRFIIAAMVAVAALVGTATPAKAAAITFSSTSANVGQTFYVDVWLTGSNPGITAFAFDFVFNSAVLDLVDISRGSLFGSWGSFNTTEGSVSGSANASIYPLPTYSSPETLARLTFTAVGVGAAGLQFTDTDLWGSFFGFPFEVGHTTSNGNGVTVGGGTQPTPVPEPGTMTLFGIGAYALARRIRRRNNRDATAA